MKTVQHVTPSVRAALDLHRHELSGAERSAVRSLAEQLASLGGGLIEDGAWLDGARRLSCSLPPRLLEVLRAFRHDPGELGALLLAGLPIGEDPLPPTPVEPDSVERVATVPASVSVLIGLQLGELVAYRQEKSGALVQNVVPVRGLEGSQSNAGSVPLEYHVENAFHPCRPDFVGLTCLRADHESNAGTLVASVRLALPRLDASDREVLHQARFTTSPPPSFDAGATTPAHPVLDGSPEDPNVCVDFHVTEALDEEAREVLERLRGAMAASALPVRLATGEMVLLDNRVVLHGRSPFTPRYDGGDRWLQRIFIHLDNRRNRVHRAGGGAVLD
ncbi:TauD/TfdA family dioxygenase [Streptomyces sp. NPDC002669]|uniref:TauD/TfdA family dioxygenase n=1 Tax=Streptomyces sp. NPDC002669 TaxID=3364658 RepID=UPI0036C363D5